MLPLLFYDIIIAHLFGTCGTTLFPFQMTVYNFLDRILRIVAADHVRHLIPRHEITETAGEDQSGSAVLNAVNVLPDALFFENAQFLPAFDHGFKVRNAFPCIRHL